MEERPGMHPENEPAPERNLLTDFEGTVRAMARVEGPGWLEVQARALRKADEAGITDTETFIEATYRTIYGAKAQLDSLDSEGTEPRIVHIIEGSGGGDRYEVWSDGTVKFQSHYARANPDRIEAARRQGFEIA